MSLLNYYVSYLNSLGMRLHGAVFFIENVISWAKISILTGTDILQVYVVKLWPNYSQSLSISAVNSNGIQSYIILHLKALPNLH